MLSKEVMPWLGPFQRSRHMDVFASQKYAPELPIDLLSELHGVSISPSVTISSVMDIINKLLFHQCVITILVILLFLNCKKENSKLALTNSSYPISMLLVS